MKGAQEEHYTTESKEEQNSCNRNRNHNYIWRIQQHHKVALFESTATLSLRDFVQTLQSLHHCVVFSMFRYNSSENLADSAWPQKTQRFFNAIQTLHDRSWFLKVSLKVHFCEEAAKCWRFPIVSHSSHKYHALTRWLTPGVNPDPGIVLINPLPLRNRAKKKQLCVISPKISIKLKT